tara:strand:- start:257 stop:1186 length:930 start_codon:yes stop_codon:yes gene_type:complete
MAIKIGGISVINDSRELASITGMNGTFTTFHPTVAAVPGTNIDLNQTMLSKAISGATTFTYSGGATGKTAVFLLDITDSHHVPTFPGDFSFQATPTWANFRYWIITIVCFSATDIKATAAGYDGTPAAPALQNSFLISGWNHIQNRQTENGNPAEAFAQVTFSNDVANDRIDVAFSGGTNAAFATVNHTYISTSGLTNITSMQAQYNVQSQSCSGYCTVSGYSFGPMPSSDGYNSGTYYSVPNSPGGRQFGWVAKTNGAGITTTSFSLNTADPDFRIKVVCDQGTLYSTCEFTQGSGNLSSRTYAGSAP